MYCRPNPNSNPNPNPTKQHAIVNIELNIIFTCPKYSEKLIRDNVVIVTLSCWLF